MSAVSPLLQVRKLTETNDAEIVQVLVRAGVVPLLFTSLSQFRRHDNVLAHVYHFLGPSFNLTLVQHALSSLVNILELGQRIASQRNPSEGAVANSSRHPFLQEFGIDQVMQLQTLISTILEEVASDQLTAWRHDDEGGSARGEGGSAGGCGYVRLEGMITTLAEAVKECYVADAAASSNSSTPRGRQRSNSAASAAMATTHAIVETLEQTMAEAGERLNEAVAQGGRTLTGQRRRASMDASGGGSLDSGCGKGGSSFSSSPSSTSSSPFSSSSSSLSVGPSWASGAFSRARRLALDHGGGRGGGGVPHPFPAAGGGGGRGGVGGAWEVVVVRIA